MNFSNYIGLPWLELGRDSRGVDCWGLVRLFYQKEMGIELPVYGGIGHGIDENPELARKINANMDNWRRVVKPSPGDCVLINIGGKPVHIGLIVSNRKMLHVAKGANSVIESFTGPKWSKRIEGFYTYAG
jgi:cell wall-associated NlpC family hydrolase